MLIGLTQYGEFLIGPVDEWGRVKIDRLVEDGTFIVVVPIIKLVEVADSSISADFLAKSVLKGFFDSAVAVEVLAKAVLRALLDATAAIDWAQAIKAVVVPVVRNIAEYGEAVFAVVDEWGRRRIDALLEDGTFIVVVPIIKVVEVADSSISADLLAKGVLRVAVGKGISIDALQGYVLPAFIEWHKLRNERIYRFLLERAEFKLSDLVDYVWREKCLLRGVRDEQHMAAYRPSRFIRAFTAHLIGELEGAGVLRQLSFKGKRYWKVVAKPTRELIERICRYTFEFWFYA